MSSFDRLSKILKETREFSIKKIKKQSFYSVHSEKLKGLTQDEVEILYKETINQIDFLLKMIREINISMQTMILELQTMKTFLYEKDKDKSI